jgi:hypothetical protein
MNRQGLQLLGMGLQWALQQAGAPLQLQLPQYSCEGAAAADSQEMDSWSALEQVRVVCSNESRETIIVVASTL